MPDQTQSAQRFWNNQAYQSADAHALADSLGLVTPKPEDSYVGFECGLMYPVRRLVITGRDTPDNFRLLFGVDQLGGQLGEIHKEQRRFVLMSSFTKAGSPAAMMHGYLDKGCPEFSPRPASETEQEQLQEFVRDYQSTAELLREVNQRHSQG